MNHRRSLARFGAGSVVPFAAVVLCFAAAGPVDPERVSIGNLDAVPDGRSYEGSVSGNGRYVAFYSAASNLLPGAGNDQDDIFVRDRKKRTTTLASPNIVDGGEGNEVSRFPAISGNGRFVLYYSIASDLVAGDAEGYWDVFLTDMKTGQVTRLSEDEAGVGGDELSYIWGASISKNGRYMVFYSGAANLVGVGNDQNGHTDVFLHDRVKGTTTLISRNAAGDSANDESYDPSMSPNGRYVAYYSRASDLVADDPTANRYDIYVYDTKRRTTEIVPLATVLDPPDNDSSDPVISDNGRYVAFWSSATNLVGTDDTNYQDDVFLVDRKTGETKRLSVANDGTEADNGSYYPAMSASGKVVVFYSLASTLDGADANGQSEDVFRYDVKKGVLTLISKTAAGTGGDAQSYAWGACLSSNGKYVVFASDASNFDSEGAVGTDDTFVLKLGK